MKTALIIATTVLLTSTYALADSPCDYHKDFNSYTCEQSSLDHPKVFFCPKGTSQQKTIEGDSSTKPSLHCSAPDGKTSFFSCKNKNDSILLLRKAMHHDGSQKPGYICLHNQFSKGMQH